MNRAFRITRIMLILEKLNYIPLIILVKKRGIKFFDYLLTVIELKHE